MVNFCGVNELYFTFTFLPLVFRENPNVGLNARVVEQIGRQCDNRFYQVAFQKPTANLTFTRSGIAVKQRRTVFDNRRSAAEVVHFIHGGLQENHLRVAAARKSVSPSARFAFCVFVAHGLFLSVLCVFSRPRRPERRIFDDETHFRIGKAIGFESIDVTEIIRVLIFDEHFGKPYRVGLPHKFLPEQFDFRRGIIVFYVGIRRGKHTARSAGLVENSDNLVAVKNIVATFCHQNFYEQLDNISTRVKLSGVHVLIKSADQIFKNVTHLDTVVGFYRQVKHGKRFDDGIQTAVLFHFVDMLVHFKFGKNVLYISRKAADIVIEVCRNMFGVVAEFF